MKIPLLKPRLFIKLKDANRRVLRDEELPCHSYVNNFYMHIISQMFGAYGPSGDSLTVYNTAGTARNNTTLVYRMGSDVAKWEPGVSNSDFGILVGTSLTGWAITNFKLGAQLTEGIGAGHLHHGAQSVPTISTLAAVRTVSRNRSFWNNSPLADITVNEIGMYIYTYMEATSGNEYMMFFRDVLASPITVPMNGGELQVTIASSLTYPETIS